MKNLLHIIILFLFICCSNKSDRNQSQISVDSKLIIANQDTVNDKVDTLSFQYFLKLTNEFKRLPQYFVDTFISSKWVDSEDAYREYYGDEHVYFKVGEVYVASISLSVYGVCSQTILTSYNKNGTIISSIRVASQCDRDLSAPTYEYSYFQILSDSIIEITQIYEEPKDKSLMDSDTIIDFSEVEQEYTESYEYYVIKSDGRFKPINDFKKYNQ